MEFYWPVELRFVAIGGNIMQIWGCLGLDGSYRHTMAWVYFSDMAQVVREMDLDKDLERKIELID